MVLLLKIVCVFRCVRRWLLLVVFKENFQFGWRLISASTLSALKVRGGSTWITDSMYLIVLTPLNIISFIFNAFCCFCVVTNGKKLASMQLYRFLLVYAANNYDVAFILLFDFCTFGSHYVLFILFLNLLAHLPLFHVQLCDRHVLFRWQGAGNYLTLRATQLLSPAS